MVALYDSIHDRLIVASAGDSVAAMCLLGTRQPLRLVHMHQISDENEKSALSIQGDLLSIKGKFNMLLHL